MHISDVCRCWEVTYCVKVFLAWLDIGGGDFEAGKFNCVSPKYKFVRVEDDAIVTTDVEPLNCLEEALGEIVSPEKRVVNTSGLIRDMRDNLNAVKYNLTKLTTKRSWYLSSSQLFAVGRAGSVPPSVVACFSVVYQSGL